MHTFTFKQAIPAVAAVVTATRQPGPVSLSGPHGGGRRRFMHALAAALLLGATVLAASAQAAEPDNYPSKPIKIIVPYPPGGASDITARVIGQKLSEAWSQPVLIENRAGASGIIGTEVVAKAPPDGYTLGLVASTHAANQGLFKKLPYDTLKDFAPVVMTASVQLVLVTNQSFAAKSVKHLIAIAKVKPGEIPYASSGPGSAPHLFAEMFSQMAGVKMTHVPYRGSTAAHPDLIGGQVSVMFDTVPAVLPHIKSGRLVPLAVGGAKRSALLPDVPTMAEAGVPGYAATSWGGVLAPAGTPPAIVAKLNKEIVRILNTPDVRERLTALGAEPVGGTSAEFAEVLRKETARFSKLVKEIGITPEQVK